MKTVGFNTGKGMNWGAFGLLAALVGLYFYRRQGGNVGTLLERSRSGIDSARNYLRKGSTDTTKDTQYAGVSGRIPESAQ